ncbi:MAG: TetR family transcriptional regulator [Dehalococcoidia bacterium]|nr:TetR family transcriptional regulator [Dehalococcoidia bacterium]
MSRMVLAPRPRVHSRVANAELVAERRSALTSAARELFLRQGFHKTSIREIAAAVGWQMGTLYLYISCKEDVLHLIIRESMDGLTRSLEAVPQQASALLTLREAVATLFRSVHDERAAVKLCYRESDSLLPEHLEDLKQTELGERGILANVIRRGIDQGEFRAVDADLFAHNIVMMAHSWALKRWALRGKFSLDDYLAGQLEFIFRPLVASGQAAS